MTPEIIEVRDFLQGRHPFDLLPPEALAAAAREIEIAYVRKGAEVVAPGARVEHLHMVRAGAVESHSRIGELLARLGEGECFGVRALLRGGEAVTRTAAIEDTLLYLLPAARFDALRRAYPAFAYHFAAFDGGPLGAALPGSGEAKGFDLLSRPLGDLLGRGPVTAPANATIRQAAETMRDERVSAALIVSGDDLVGIVTDRDLRNTVVAGGLPPETPVTAVMTPAPFQAQAQDLVFQALLTMSRHDIHHLPVLDKGRLAGCVTASSLIDAQASSPLYLAHAIHEADDVAALAAQTARVPQVVDALTRAGATAHGVGEIVTALADAVTRATIRLAEAELGPPPLPYAWMAAGSQGRREQTALSDQDNCLILDDAYDEARHGAYFAAFAGFVADGLNACGYAYCPGEMMARTPRWRQPLAAWRRDFARWIEEPEPRALMLSCIFFDLRPICGTPALWEELRDDILDKSRRNHIFLAHMAANAMLHEPPIGFFRNLVLVYGGGTDAALDLKHHGVVPIVDLARIYALSAGVAAVNTRDRLDGAVDARALSRQGAMDLKDALEFIALTRLRHQARQVRERRAPDNLLSPRELSSFERGNLKNAFQVVKDMQASMASAYQLGRF